MFDSKTQIVNIAEIIKDPNMSEFVPDHVKTKKMCKHAIKKLLFQVYYVPDRHKTQQMCSKVSLRNSGMLMLICDCYKVKRCIIVILMH